MCCVKSIQKGGEVVERRNVEVDNKDGSKRCLRKGKVGIVQKEAKFEVVPKEGSYKLSRKVVKKLTT